MKKRILGLLLALVMVLEVFSLVAVAAESFTFDTDMPTPTSSYINIKQVSLSGVQGRKATVSNGGFTWDVLLTSCEENIGIALTLDAAKTTYRNAAQVSLNGSKYTQGQKGAWSTTVPADFASNNGTISHVLTTRFMTNVQTQRNFTLNITLLDEDYVNQAPVLVSNAANVKILSGDSYALDLNTVFEDPDDSDSALTYAVSTDGGEAQTTAAAFTYTADADFIGTKTFAFTAKDPAGLTSNAYTVTLSVVKNTPPAVAEGAISSAESMVGLPSTMNLAALFTDIDGDAMTYTVQENGGETKAAAAQYTYTPATLGDHTLVFQATDARGAQSPTHTVVLTAGENPAPTLAGDATASASGTIPFTYTADLSTFFTDNEGDTLTYTVRIDGAEATSADASFSYAPQTTGDHTLVFTATDRAGGISPAYTVTVTAAENPAPTLAGDATATASGILPFTYTLDLTTVFTDSDALTYTVKLGEADPVVANSNFVCIPETVGVHTLVFHATDTSGGVSPAYTVTLTAMSNPAPTLAEGVEATSTATAYQYFAWNTDLSTFFADNEGDTLTYTVKIGEAEATAANAAYSVTFDTAGEQTLVFQAMDFEGGLSPTHTVVLTVKESFKETINTFCKSNGKTGDTFLSSIQFTGPKILQSLWNAETDHVEGEEHSLFVRLAADTPDDAAIAMTYTAGYHNSGFKGSVSGPASVTLFQGKATAKVTTSGWMSNGIPRTYYINFTTEPNAIPAVAADAPASAEVFTGDAFTLDLGSIFSDANGDALTYTAAANGEELGSVEAAFSKTIGTSGTHTFVFTATDVWNASVSHTVAVTAVMREYTDDLTVYVPADVSPTFFVTAGHDVAGTDIAGEALTAVAGTADGLVPYTVKIPQGLQSITVRSSNGAGMAFSVPQDGSAVTLRNAKVIPTDLGGKDVTATVTVAYGDRTAKADASGNYLLATGLQYTCTAVPADTAQYLTGTATITVESGRADAELTVSLPYNNPKTIIAPTDAEVHLYDYNKYYDFTDLPLRATVDNGDGTATYYFTTSANDLSYRVSVEGKITKAGYWTGGSSVTVTYSANDAEPTARPNHDSGTAQGSIAEDSVLLNVNAQNFLAMPVGGTKTLKGYRAWEIIKNDSTNEIITPDFHFEILPTSDDGVVALTDKASPSNGDGDWKTLTAVKEGTAFVEVSYDAIQVSGGSYPGVYSATDPSRTGLVVIQVGGSTANVNFGIHGFASQGSAIYSQSTAKAWDAEFDTLYFTGKSGSLTLSPTASDAIAEVAVSHDKGCNWTILTAEDGVYTAPIVSGNNIIRVTTESGTAYQVVRGDNVTYTMAEVSGMSDGDGIVEAGETVRVTLNGLHTPIPKMAGNYNPGYGGNQDGNSYHVLRYTFADASIASPGAQYNFMTKTNYVDVTIPADSGETAYVLQDGYISMGVIGLTSFTAGGDSHRNIPDGGCTTRGSTTTFHTRSILPEITVTLGMEAMPNTPPKVRADAPTAASLELSESVYTYALNLSTAVFTDDDPTDVLTYTVSVNGGEATSPTNGIYTLERPEPGTYTLRFTATDGKASAEHILTLTVTKAVTPAPGPGNQPSDGIKGYVYVSFEDKGIRVSGETGVDYPTPLGTIIPATAVPFYEGDTIADVTLRLLDMNGITYSHSGTTKENFYLSKICGFAVGGVRYDSFGEFDAGQGSGWMITWGGPFINMGASAFLVKNGDAVRWQYTCQYGKDIGDPYWGSIGNTTADTAEKENTEEAVAVFADVKESDYFYDAVKWAVENGITNGTSANDFSPAANCTRAQMVTFLWRAAGCPEPKTTTHSFTDADESAYWFNALLWAVEAGITSGTSATTFSPDAVCTRAQMATFLYRSAKSPAPEGSHGFVDMAADAYYGSAVLWAASQGITNGTSDTTFSPEAVCTRAQMVTFLYRYLKN